MTARFASVGLSVAADCKAVKKLPFCAAVIRMLKFFIKTALALFALPVLLAAAAFFFPQQFLCVDSGKASADAIVVLGGGSHERPLRAAELFKQRAAPRVIVSGAGDDETSRQILISNGVPSGAIQIESKSQTTRENAQFTVRLLRAEKIHSAIIVTSWYHSRRALACFEHYAPEMKFYSRPSYFDFARKDWTRNLAKRIYLEYAKLPDYWIRYGVRPFD
jgi:uncharacterized SAM-binding protein YcdF (DUF218 family)